MRRGVRHGLVGGALVLAGTLGACERATQITVAITTDIPCDQLRGVSVEVGSPGTVAGASAAVTAEGCVAPGVVGELALTPISSDSATIEVVVIAGRAKSSDECTSLDGYGGCVIARRVLHYLKHLALRLPVRIHQACEGVACNGAGALDTITTCNQAKACVSALVDPAACATDEGCDVTGDAPGDPLPPGSSVDASGDGRASDAAPRGDAPSSGDTGDGSANDGSAHDGSANEGSASDSGGSDGSADDAGSDGSNDGGFVDQLGQCNSNNGALSCSNQDVCCVVGDLDEPPTCESDGNTCAVQVEGFILTCRDSSACPVGQYCCQTSSFHFDCSDTCPDAVTHFCRDSEQCPPGYSCEPTHSGLNTCHAQ